jgi:hypothetical protein
MTRAETLDRAKQCVCGPGNTGYKSIKNEKEII